MINRVPQIEVLKRAALCITHAGINTALESLAEGVPMVAIPIGFDQPGIAARIAYHGVGEFIEVEDLRAGAADLRPFVHQPPPGLFIGFGVHLSIDPRWTAGPNREHGSLHRYRGG
jgi:UDP-glucoronosyl and UDP-glucosyl transferase